jgi:hypothetical protein
MQPTMPVMPEDTPEETLEDMMAELPNGQASEAVTAGETASE